MQQVAVLNFAVGEVEVYTIDDGIDAEDFLVDELDLSLDEICWMVHDGVMPITIHA
jgi:hypothetical protein